MCKACQRSMSCFKTLLIRHAETAMHKRSVQSNRMDGRQRQGNLVQCLRQQGETSSFSTTMEARVWTFLAEHNLPFIALISLLKSTIPTNPREVIILKGIHLSATKCTNILRQGLQHHPRRNYRCFYWKAAGNLCFVLWRKISAISNEVFWHGGGRELHHNWSLQGD
jgi:hypothetical protein